MGLPRHFTCSSRRFITEAGFRPKRALRFNGSGFDEGSGHPWIRDSDSDAVVSPTGKYPHYAIIYETHETFS
jgi:hypothetical protein